MDFPGVVEADECPEIFVVRRDQPLLGPGQSHLGVDDIGRRCVPVAIAVAYQAQIFARLDDGRTVAFDAAARGRRRKVSQRDLQGHFIEDRPSVGERLTDLGVGRAKFAMTPPARVEGQVDVQAGSFLRSRGDVRASDGADACQGVDLWKEFTFDRLPSELGSGHRFPRDADLGPLSRGDLQTLHKRQLQRRLEFPGHECEGQAGVAAHRVVQPRDGRQLRLAGQIDVFFRRGQLHFGPQHVVLFRDAGRAARSRVAERGLGPANRLFLDSASRAGP